MNHPLRNFQRGPTWSSNNDPLVASNRIMDDLQCLPGIRMKSIVDRDSGTIGILECCSITIARPHDFSFWTIRWCLTNPRGLFWTRVTSEWCYYWTAYVNGGQPPLTFRGD